MENFKIKINSEADSKEAQELLFQLDYAWSFGKSYMKLSRLYNFITAYECDRCLGMGYGKDAKKEITLHELRDMAVLHRNDVNDATHEDNGHKYYVASDDKLYGFFIDSWALFEGGRSPTFKPINKQPDAVDSPNDIARTAEIHREHNLANELNDLCAEFGCLPGVDRMAWLRGQLRIAKTVRILGAELTSQCNW